MTYSLWQGITFGASISALHIHISPWLDSSLLLQLLQPDEGGSTIFNCLSSSFILFLWPHEDSRRCGKSLNPINLLDYILSENTKIHQVSILQGLMVFQVFIHSKGTPIHPKCSSLLHLNLRKSIWTITQKLVIAHIIDKPQPSSQSMDLQWPAWLTSLMQGCTHSRFALPNASLAGGKSMQIMHRCKAMKAPLASKQFTLRYIVVLPCVRSELDHLSSFVPANRW